MTDNRVDDLLGQANTYADQGEWQQAIECLEKARTVSPADTGIMTGIGLCYLHLGQAGTAVSSFLKVVEIIPDSFDALNNLGIAYTLAGNLADAEKCYKKILSLDPNNASAWKNLAQVYLRQEGKTDEGVQILASIVQSDPSDNEALMLMATCYQLGEDYPSAETLYQQVLKNDPEHADAREALALVQKKISDSSQNLRNEQIKKLNALKKFKTQPEAASSTQSASQTPAVPAILIAAAQNGPIALLGIPELMRTDQMNVWVTRLRQQGVEVKIAAEFSPADLDDYAFFIFTQPNLSGTLLNGLNKCLTAGKKFAVDLDHDFHHISEDQSTYSLFGRGNPKAIQSLEIMLNEAEWVSVSSYVLQERYKPYAKNVELVLPTWNRDNAGWLKPSKPRDTFNIGWLGTEGDRIDLSNISTEISEFMAEHPKARLVLTGDQGAYKIFPQVAEEQIIVLPPVLFADDLPYIFSQFDVLILPKANTPYNQAESFQMLMYAGAAKVPWIAAPLPAYQFWRAGGRFVNTGSDWKEHLEFFYQNPDKRKMAGHEGHKRAEEV